MCRINLLALPGFETRIKRKYSVIADRVSCQVWVYYCRTGLLILPMGQFKAPTKTEAAACTQSMGHCEGCELLAPSVAIPREYFSPKKTK